MSVGVFLISCQLQSAVMPSRSQAHPTLSGLQRHLTTAPCVQQSMHLPGGTDMLLRNCGAEPLRSGLAEGCAVELLQLGSLCGCIQARGSINGASWMKTNMQHTGGEHIKSSTPTSFLMLLLRCRFPPFPVLVNAQTRALGLQLDVQRRSAAGAAGAQALPLGPAHALQQLEAPASRRAGAFRCSM